MWAGLFAAVALAQSVDPLVAELASRDLLFVATLANVRVTLHLLSWPQQRCGVVRFRRIEPLRGSDRRVRFCSPDEARTWTDGDRYLVVIDRGEKFDGVALFPPTPGNVAEIRAALAARSRAESESGAAAIGSGVGGDSGVADPGPDIAR